MDSISPLERRENLPIKAAKMHVLVHPGYIEDVMGYNSQKLAQAQTLFEKYKRVAGSLPSNEIMIILVHNLPEKFQEDIGADVLYTKNIKLIQTIKPKQIIILPSNAVPFSGASREDDKQALNKIKSIAQNRGYQIGPETEVEVFGETYDECVQEAFLGIVNTNSFNQGNVRVVEELTDKV